MIPKIEMEVITEDCKLETRLITLQEAKFFNELGRVDLDEYESWEFNKEAYIDAFMETEWADSFMRFVKGLNGTYEETKSGQTWWSQEDAEFFETLVMEKL